MRWRSCSPSRPASSYAAGIYLMLRRRLAQLIIGLACCPTATNLLIFTAGGLTRGRPPVVPAGATALVAAVRGPGAAGARPDRDRDRLRRSGLLAGARASRARDADTDDVDDVGPGAMRMLVLPILVPLQHRGGADAGADAPAAAAVAVARRRRSRCWRARCWLFVRVNAGRPSGAAGRRLAGAVRHHPGRRPARGDAGRRRRRRRAGGAGLRPLPASIRRREALRLPPADPDPAHGRLRRVPDRRPLQPLRLVRGHAGRVLRADGAAAGHRQQMAAAFKYVDAQPDRVVALPHRARAALRRHRHAQHGRPRARLAERAHPASTPCWRCCS